MCGVLIYVIRLGKVFFLSRGWDVHISEGEVVRFYYLVSSIILLDE